MARRVKLWGAIQLVVIVISTLLFPTFAAEQSWPSRSVTLVVPFAAGGGTDAIARVVAEKLAPRLGQPVVVENKAGAASAIGTAYAAKSAPDDYTLLMTTNSAMVILPLTQPAGSLNYDRNDLTLIGLTGILPNLLIVSPKVPANSVTELIAHAKSRPGKLSFASSGNGTMHSVHTMQGVLAKLARGDLSFFGKGVGFEEYKTIVALDDWARVEDRFR